MGLPGEITAQGSAVRSGTTVTEEVYRKQIRPVITEGAEVMDRLFPGSRKIRICARSGYGRLS
jgi:hypothetical protein